MYARWKTKDVDRMKEKVRKFINTLAELSPSHKQKAILERMSQLTDDTDADQALEKLVLAISCLAHHVQSGGLKDKDVRNLMELAKALIVVNGIKPVISGLAGLYGELQLIKSNLLLKQGNTWAAAWEHQIGIHESGKFPPGGSAFQNLILGVKILRVGQVSNAIGILKSIDPESLQNFHQELLIITMLRGLRLGGHQQQFESWTQRAHQIQHPSRQFLLELDWERTCLKSDNEGLITDLIQKCRRGKSHYQASYLVETNLWIYASNHKGRLHSLPKISTILRNRNLDGKSLGLIIRIASTIENLYDQDIPFTNRLRQLGQDLAEVGRIRNLDKELLVWLSAARWLARNNNYTLASLCFSKYRNLSFAITDGQSGDCLNLAADLTQKSWFLSEPA